jgi:hypothetical protein
MTGPDDVPAAPPPRRRVSVFAAVALVLAGVALIAGSLVVRGGPGPSTAPASATDSPVAASTGAPATESPTATIVVPPPGSPSTGYLVLPADLADRAAKAAKGIEPWASALTQLKEDADAALGASPQPAASLDIPGTEGPFVDDTATAYGLGLAYAVTGDIRYAEGARRYIRAWVTTTKELVNACPTDGSCQTSLIVARVVPDFVFAADLIRPSGVFTVDDDTEFRAWLHDLILPALPIRPNNWGDAGNFSRAVITDYLGDQAGFNEALDEWRSRMDLVASDGHLPEEVRRGTSGMLYTQEALQYKLAVARLAELRGVDLWSVVGKNGGTLEKALGVLETYWFHPSAWPWNSHVGVPPPGPMWEIAYQHYQDPAWPAIFTVRRPYGNAGHSAIRWTTMTNGIPIK